ncbi:hypothetical protein QJS10_CPB14g00230 [Acorus calamus]|uniref:Uncharacterized protein n=1 Tax=Acorus calamus TaxID=4465 RepID=A0AAV9D9G7_ACOCL|nr:hypothetical protein QJS10_CPB14g00230 [Acorus calamus]
MEDYQRRKSTKKVASRQSSSASPTLSSLSTPETINLGDTGDFMDIERPLGNKVEKERLGKCKGKGHTEEDDSSATIAKLLKEIREEKKQMNALKVDIMNRGGAGYSASGLFEPSTPNERSTSGRSMMSWQDVYNIAVKWR